MLGLAQRRRPRPADTRTKSVPAPVKGWNTRDPLAGMDPQNAVILDNWFPDDEEVVLRRGYTSHATGIGSGAVESLLEYNAPSGANKLFACGNSAIYDATNAGAVGAAAVSGLSNNRWQSVNFGTTGGNFLWACNGADEPRHFDGTVWATPSIMGVTSTALVWVNVHQNRLFFGENGSLKFAYLPVNSVQGTAAEFDLSSLARRGGFLMGMVTWTRDSGDGMDDLAVFVTSEGEAIVYAGTDPTQAATWALQGVFRIGKPIGRRFYVKFGGDAILITEDGFLPLSTLLTTERGSEQKRRAISAQISKSVNTAVRDHGSLFGWDAFIYPRGRWLLFNIPSIENDATDQYVFNMTTKAPCRFTGMNANCWALLNDEPYFGGTDGTVYRADNGTNDNDTDIVGDLQPAYNYFGASGRQKLFKLARPIFAASGQFSAAFDMNVDFDEQLPSSTPTFEAPSQTLWNNFNWNEANWGGGVTTSKNWESITGEGFAGALRIRTQVRDITISLRAIDYVYEIGGVL